MRDTVARPFVPPAGWLGPAAGEAPGLSAPFLVAATLLGAVLRLAGLTRQSLWVDEAMTWQAVRPGAGLQFLEQVRDSIQGPLYTAVVWPLVRLGDPELMLRLPAAVAGVLTVPLFAAVAVRLLDRRGARLAVLLVAINPFLVWYSQEARGYAFAVFFGVAMALAFLRMLERGPNRADGAAFALASAAAAWSNLSGIFLWAALGLTLLVRPPRTGRAWAGWAVAFGVGFLAMVPWLLQATGIWAVDRIVPGAATGEALRGETTFAPLALPYTLFTFFFGFSYGPSLRELHQPDRLQAVRDAWPWLAAGGLPVLVGAVAAVGGLRRRWPLLLWIVVPALALLVLALRNVKPWNPRYLAVAAPWALALVAAGLVRLPRWPGTALTALLCAATLVSLGNSWLSPRYAKEDLRAAAAWIAASERPDWPVLVPEVTTAWRFYGPPGLPVITAFGAGPLGDPADADAFVAARLAGVDGAWIVLAREWAFDPGGLLVPALGRAGAVAPAAGFAGVRVLSWQAPPSREAGRGG
ncbi:MAG: glycosyltransferase family 39 protein [Candidatus Krumholzibacteriia bacterium]